MENVLCFQLLFVTTCIGLSQAVTYPALTRQQYAELVAQQQAAPEHQQQLEPSQPQTVAITPKRLYKQTPQALVEDEAVQSAAQYKQVLEQPVYYQQYQQPQAAPQVIICQIRDFMFHREQCKHTHRPIPIFGYPV